MNTNSTLDPQFRSAIANLVIDDHAGPSLVAVPDNQLSVVCHGLERALVDRRYPAVDIR